MPWNGSGTFTELYGNNKWQTDRDNGVPIQATSHDARDQDNGSGINNCIAKDGQNSPTANLPMGGFIHTNVGNATARNNYSSVAQLQDSTPLWGGTSSGAANVYAITLSPVITAYVAGQTFRFLSHQANSGASTINVNAVGSRNITKNGTTALSIGDISSGEIIEVVYDGAEFQLISRTPTVSTPAVSQIVVKTSSVASTIDFSTSDLGTISGSYYLIKFDGLNPGTSNVTLTFEISGNNLSSFATMNYRSSEARTGSTSLVYAGGTNQLVANLEAFVGVGSSAASGHIILPVASASRYTRTTYQMECEKTVAGGSETSISGGGMDGGSLSSWNSFRLKVSSGNFATGGTVTVYRYL